MISVYVRKDGGECVALCTVTAPNYSNDKRRLLKRVHKNDIAFEEDCIPKYYRVHNAQRYKDAVVEIGDAIRVFEECDRWI